MSDSSDVTLLEHTLRAVLSAVGGASALPLSPISSPVSSQQYTPLPASLPAPPATSVLARLRLQRAFIEDVLVASADLVAAHAKASGAALQSPAAAVSPTTSARVATIADGMPSSALALTRDLWRAIERNSGARVAMRGVCR
jgi:hypothetical protein